MRTLNNRQLRASIDQRVKRYLSAGLTRGPNDDLYRSALSDQRCGGTGTAIDCQQELASMQMTGRVAVQADRASDLLD
jgi:hypothetical protein